MLFAVLLCSFLTLGIGNAARYLKFDSNEFAFASYYQNNMVLQMAPYRAVIWGYGTVGAIVNVSLIQDVYSTKVQPGPDDKGVWSVTLKSHAAGGPVMIQGVQDNHGLLHWILLKGVLFGDVWICSGQSNMQFTVSMLKNPAQELELASKYTDIRLMTVMEEVSPLPKYDLIKIQELWSIPSNATLAGTDWSYFSAVCWLYGRHLFDALQVPIGLVSSTWGGTPIEAWSSGDALNHCGLDGLKQVNPSQNSVLWNAMIHPLLNMTIKGAIWYQGESNYHYHNSKYACSFPAMIKDWRRKWFEGTGKQTHKDFPFGFVQLAPVNSTDDGTFSLIRWHQTADYGFAPNEKMPNTFMAVAMDLPDNGSPFGSIHPRDKDDVATRLVAGSLNVAYGWNIAFQGPYPLSLVRSEQHHVVLTYPNDQKLHVTEQGSFQVCCTAPCNISEPTPSPSWTWTPIISHQHPAITVDTRACINSGGKAEMIRYAWSLTPCKIKKCSVYNDQGFPAPPFVLPVSDMKL